MHLSKKDVYRIKGKEGQTPRDSFKKGKFKPKGFKKGKGRK